MPYSGQQSQVDKVQIGTSPRFTAITAGALVRAGVGICRYVTITGAAGAVIDLWDGAVGTGQLIWHAPATLGPGTYWIEQSFANGLNIVIATAVTDLIVATGGI
jgi:hypothetical protein